MRVLLNLWTIGILCVVLHLSSARKLESITSNLIPGGNKLGQQKQNVVDTYEDVSASETQQDAGSEALPESTETNEIEDEVASPEVVNEVLEESNVVPQETVSEATVVNMDDSSIINRYCRCTAYECNCCRDIDVPLFPVKGPGCAVIQYLDGDRMSVGVKFADRMIVNRVISARRATPVCLPLPGGYNRFCGRIYGISRKANEGFKACLGLELRADDEVEAVLRVSCFKFGPRGLSVMDPEPLPPVDDIDVADEEDEDDEDEEEELFGFGLGDGSVQDNDQGDSPDYTGFSFLDRDLMGSIFGVKKFW
ncbi:AGAP002168-PA-like protein [Anopheles sinensis]|uniref:AGAP002168-PA-like protein n=1 Tax=Anopheles sinensis TaxID=74873 RepID=A0A084VCT9_ANOSI|nr:AGAP002168-PA-like protein [Anopheles sinensis]